MLLKLDDQKPWSTPSTVVRSDPHNRSYVVTTGAGVSYRRNRRHMQGTSHTILDDDADDDADDDDEHDDVVVPPVMVAAAPGAPPLMRTRCVRPIRPPMRYD